MIKDFGKNKFGFENIGEYGLPENYPTPRVRDLLFYIQRNLNNNTIVYTLNVNASGEIDQQHPLKVFWIRYDHDGETQELNPIQNKLAYGYKSWKINHETFKFQLVSYKQDFYLATDDNGQYCISTELAGDMLKVSNIYVYAEDFGVFPQVKYIEFFGNHVETDFPAYKKVIL